MGKNMFSCETLMVLTSGTEEQASDPGSAGVPPVLPCRPGQEGTLPALPGASVRRFHPRCRVVAGTLLPVEGKMPSLPGEKGIVMTMFLTDIGKRVMILAVKSKNETC